MAVKRIIAKLLEPTEWVSLATAFITVLLYSILAVPFRDVTGLYLQQLLAVLYLYPLGLLLAFIMVSVHHGYQQRRQGLAADEAAMWRSFVAQYLHWQRWLSDIRRLHQCIVVLVIYALLKHLIPFLNPVICDPAFVVQERWMLGGELAHVWLRQVFSVDWAPTISTWYQGYYAFLSTLVFVMVMQRVRPDLSARFCLSFCLTWFFSMALVYLFPTWGPCFYLPSEYIDLPSTSMTIMQADLWSMWLDLRTNPNHPSALFAISGFPSLHVAVVALGMAYLTRIHVVLGIVAAVYLMLTIIATLYFGWHYVLDDVMALLVVVGVERICNRVVWFSDKQLSK